MKLTDLRIGNCIKEDGEIINITKEYFSYLLKWFEAKRHRFEPIRLTPEIMNLAGFKKNGFEQFDFDLFEHLKYHVLLVVDLRSGYIWLRDGLPNEPNMHDIVCVWNRDFKMDYCFHQLQNLYYSLTGQERTVNFPVPAG